MRTISPFEFVRRFKHGIVEHQTRVVWFLGAGCSVSSGVADAASLTMHWLAELKYLETGDEDDLEDWGESRFPTFDRNDPAAAYIQVHEALFYNDQDQQREQERLSVAGQPGFGYATLAQLMTHDRWSERCNTVITTNFDDLAADALYFYSQRKPQVLTHESFDRHVQISGARPTIVKLYGDAHLGAEYLDGNRRLLRTDVKERLRAQLTEATMVFVGYGGRDDCILDLLDGLPHGAPSGGIYWVNDKPPGKSLSDWLGGRNAVWAQNESFDDLMYLMNREFELGHPRIDRFDKILQKYDEQYRALAKGRRARAEKQRAEEAAEGGETSREAPVPVNDAVVEVSAATDGTATEKLHAEEPVAEETATGELAAEEAAPPEPSALEEVQAEIRPFDPYGVKGGRGRSGPKDRPVIGSKAVAGSADTADADADADADDDEAEILDLHEEAPAAASEEPPAAASDEPPDGRRKIDALIAAAVKAMADEPERTSSAVDMTTAADGDVVAIPFPSSAKAKTEDTPKADDAPTQEAENGNEDPSAAQALPDRPRPAPVRSPDAETIDVVDGAAKETGELRPPKRLMRRDDAVALDARYRAAMAENPRDAALLAQYAQFLTVGRRDHDGAEHYFNRAIDADPQNDEALRLFAAFLTDVRRDHDRAEDCYRLAIRADFESPETMCAYAEFLWHARGDFETAGECFQVAVDAAPRDPNALMRYARFLRAVQRNDEAAFALLKVAAASAGDDPAPVVALAEFMAARQGDVEKAEAGFERAVEMAPQSAETLAAAAGFHADRKADPDRAEALYRRALQADSGAVGARLSFAQFLHEKRGDAVGAERHLNRAVDADPADAHTVLAQARFREEALADDEAADDAYRRAVSLDPNNATALAHYGRFLQYSRKKPNAAEDRLRKAVALEPRNPLALRSYGWFLERERGNSEDAERYLRRAVAAAPTDAGALADLGQFLGGRLGSREEADEMFRRALASDPDNKQALRRYARFTSDGKGDPGGAEKLYRKVLDESPKDARALAGAAHSMFVQGRRDEGLSLLERAFDAAMGGTPKRRSLDLHLELWLYRYAFDRSAGRDAIKAAIWLVKEGARVPRTDLLPIVSRALADGHAEPDLMRELARVASGDSTPERLERFNVA